MEDEEIYQLYWKRSEQAIVATHEKYGGWCRGIAYRILHTLEETDECVSDTYFTVWNKIPPQKPSVFRAWIGRITRNLALDRYRALTAQKRGGAETQLVLEELQECVSGTPTPQEALDAKEVTRVIRAFFARQPEDKRNIFLRRYWHMSSIREIAAAYSISESKVTSILHRQRKQLRAMMEKEGVAL